MFSFRGADFVPVWAHDSQKPSGCARREPGALCRKCGVLRDGQDHAFVPCGEPLCCSVLPQLDGWRVTCLTIRHCELSDETRSVKPIVFPRTRAPRLVTTDTPLPLGSLQFCLYRGACPWPLWAKACEMLHVTAPVRESRYASQSGDHSHWRRLRFKTWRIVVNVLRPTVRGGSSSEVLTTLTPRCCSSMQHYHASQHYYSHD